MRRIIVPVLILVVIVAAALAWRASRENDDSGVMVFSGYVDADYVFVTSAVGGVLAEMRVNRGDDVPAGTQLFTIDDKSERGARDQAQGQLQQAQAQTSNLLTGRRPDELAAIVAQQAQAAATLKNAEVEFQRQTALLQTGVTTKQALDNARSARDTALGHVNEMAAQLRVARLPGRDDEIRAAQASVVAAQGALEQAEWRLSQTVGTAPAKATVVDTLYRPGEVIQAGLPVVQLLPPENIKLRFFVPERIVPKMHAGQKIAITCDGCGKPIAATVRFVSPRAEFTPPVIYSREQRTRMVFLVEARPDERLEAMRVGQPIDVNVDLK